LTRDRSGVSECETNPRDRNREQTEIGQAGACKTPESASNKCAADKK
jgi:hypothetical protein